jgi:hypothetical protein
MAPIYDTDLADSRYSQSEWNHYELWEKVEVRLRRRRRIWIGAAVAVYVALSSIPIFMERAPKWRSLALARRLGQEINSIKRAATVEQRAFRIRFKGEGSLDYRIESSPSCSSTQSTLVREGTLAMSAASSGQVILGPIRGAELGVPGLAESFCYDYLAGSESIVKNEPVMGFAVAPVRDLAGPADDSRLDRVSVVVLSGPSADVSFE